MERFCSASSQSLLLKSRTVMGVWMARICPGKASAGSQGLGVYSGPTLPYPWGRIRGWKTSRQNPVLPPFQFFCSIISMPSQYFSYVFHPQGLLGADWYQAVSEHTACAPAQKAPERTGNEGTQWRLPTGSISLPDTGQEADAPCGLWDLGLELADPSIMGHSKNRSICGRA